MKKKLKTEGLTGDQLTFVKMLNDFLGEIPEGMEKSDVEAEIKTFLKSLLSDDGKLPIDAAGLKALQDATDETKEGSLAFIVKAHAAAITGLKEATPTDDIVGMKGFRKALGKAIKAQAAEIAEAIKGGKAVKLTLKAADTITTGNFAAGVIRGLRLEAVDPLERNPQNILNEITILDGGPGSNPFSWVEIQAKEGGAASVSEGAEKPYYDLNWIENKANAEFIAAIVPVSKQALLNMPQLRSIIETELIAEVREVLQTKVLLGTGVAPDIKGISQYATAFSAGTLVGTVVEANDYDVIRAAAAQVRRNKGVANVAFVSPDKLASMDLTKGNDGHYAIPPFKTADGTVIAGVRVVDVFDLTGDEFIIGDMKRYMLNIVEDLTIEVGYINDQFRRNQLSIKGEIYAAGGMKAQHTNKIVKGEFAAARAVLNKA